MWPVCPIPPLGTPLGPLHRLDGHPLAKRGLATYAPHRAKATPPLAKKKGTGQWMATGGAGIFFRTYPHYPFGVGGRAFRPAFLKHLSQTNRPVKTYHRKSYPAGVFRSFSGFRRVKVLSPKELGAFSGTPPTTPTLFL